MKSQTKPKSRLLCAFLALLMLLSVVPTTIFAAPASDIPDEMLNNPYLDALAYTKYKVQAQKDDGTIFKTYSSRASAYLSNISYGLVKYGTETVSDSSTKTGLAPDIAGFESSGLCCASYVSYVYYNYLPNIKGIDTSDVARPDNPRSATSYNSAANSWVSSGKARRISFSQSSDGNNFVPSEEIPIGSLIVFKHIPTGEIAHVAIYAGEYNGTHFVTHTGNDRGPEISTIVGMSKGDYPEAVVQVVVPTFVEESGKIEIYKKDPNGRVLSGARFTATKVDDPSKIYDIGPTDSNGYAATKDDLPYGQYKVVETVFPANYTSNGTSTWTVTVSSANNGVVTINAVNKLKTGKIEVHKKDPNGKDLSGAIFTVYDSSNKVVTTIGPTNTSGYASKDGIEYGTYKVVETTFPKNYQSNGKTEWSVTLSDSNNGVVVVNAENKLKQGKIEVYKTDPNGMDLSGAIFTVYDSSNKVVTTIGPTNSDGYAFKDKIDYGSYHVVETKFPRNYKAYGPTEWDVTLSEDNDGLIVVRAKNELKKGYIEVIKTDAEDGRDLSGAEFTVYDASGKVITVIGPTDKTGYAKSEEIYYGSYRVLETKIPEYYQQGKVKEWNVTIDDDNNGMIKLDINNNRQYGSFKVIKISEDNFKENFQFRLTGTSIYGDYIDMTVSTDVNGVALFDPVPIGTEYEISEVNTPIRYVIPEDQEGPVEWEKVTEREFDNVLKKWRAEVYKLDSSAKSSTPVYSADNSIGAPQGDATLAGAVYGVYRDGLLIDTYTTDANGHFTTDYYICDTDWTIREISPSPGYTLDETVYYVGADPKNFVYERNTVEMTTYETVIKGNVTIIKHTDDGSTQIETPEEGATFQMYLKSAGSYENAKESERDILVCDELGFAESKMVPYGVYTIHQISGWEGREMMHDFDVFVSEDGKTYHYLINNAEFESYIKVIKTDAESGLPIPYAGAEFQIFDPDGNKVVMSYTYPTYTEVDTFLTNSDGYLITPQCLPYGKGYTLVEVKAPYSYVLDSTPIPFDVEEDTATEDGVLTVVVVTRSNMPQKGVIHISKTGEVFQTVVEADGIFKPVYEIKGLAGAIYDIYAAEDIYTLDGVLHYSKGDLVDTVKTGADGVGTSKELYLGKYEIKESEAPHAMVLNSETKSVELVYAGQHISVTETAAEFYNIRQKVEVSLKKQLEQNELFGIGMNGELADITFGLYAAEDILAADGTVIPKDGLIEIITFDANGNATCETDLPLGNYYLQERSTNAHYKLNTHKYEFAFTYAGQEISIVEVFANDGEAIDNDLKYGSVSGLKIDEDGETIKGAVFGLFRNDETEFTEENALMIDTSLEDGHFSFKKVPYGTWIVRELVPAEGFVLNEKSYQITITEDKQIIKIELENRYIYSDVEGMKIDEDGETIEGAVFGLFSEDETEFTEENALMIDTSDSTGTFRFEHLRYGHYLVRELVPAEGFVLNETVYPINVTEDGAVISIQFENRYIRGDILGLKVDEDGLPVSGALFGLFKPGDAEFTEETAVLTAVSDEDGYFRFENIRYGSWVVRELVPAEGFVLNETLFPVEVTTDGAVIEIEAVNRHIYGGVATIKVDADYPDHRLTGAVFEIYQDVDGNGEFDPKIDILIDELTEIGTGIYQRENLRYGGYFLHEKVAPEGFILDEGYYYFSITHDGEIVIVENNAGVGFINEAKKSNLKIVKSSSDGKLEGFSFLITGENYSEVFTTDENGEIYVEGLRLGTYVITEVEDSASAGYKRPDPVTIELVENETLTVKVHNDKVTVDVPQTGDNSNLALWIGLMIASLGGLGATFLMSRKKKRFVEE